MAFPSMFSFRLLIKEVLIQINALIRLQTKHHVLQHRDLVCVSHAVNGADSCSRGLLVRLV